MTLALSLLAASATLVSVLLCSKLPDQLWTGIVEHPALFFGLGAWLLSATLGWPRLVRSIVLAPRATLALRAMVLAGQWPSCWRFWPLSRSHLFRGAIPADSSLARPGCFRPSILRGWDIMRDTRIKTRLRGRRIIMLLSALACAAALCLSLGFHLRRFPRASRLEGIGVAGTLRWLMNPLLDLDQDGSEGQWAGGQDCSDLDPSLGPGSWERLANGKDDNCSKGDATRADLKAFLQQLRAQQRAAWVLAFVSDQPMSC